jgi:Nucleotidyl transferase AbiEii toxin, Type IV TA system
VDVAVPVADDREAEAIIRSLQGAGYKTAAVLDHESGRLATVRLVAPGEPAAGILLDLLFATTGVELEVAQAATSVEVFPGVTVFVAQRGDLIAMKVLSCDGAKRPRDSADLRALLASAGPEDLDRARTLLRLITERGFSRGKDLLADLASLLT